MTYTNEQHQIISYVNENKDKGFTLLVNSMAGVGKSFILSEISKLLSDKQGLYLAYNKSIATEAATKFPSNVQCKTIHSMAYQATVRPYKLKVGSFNAHAVRGKYTYDDKYAIVNHLSKFCLSKYTNVSTYFEEQHPETPIYIQQAVENHLKAMWDNQIECSHDFYLKMFHICLLDGTIKYPTIDFVMIDEVGDINEVIIEIFQLLPAKIRIAVGDAYQNIYTFNHTVNCFTSLIGPDVKLMNLTQSFRVSNSIAKKVEKFLRKYVSPDINFNGITYEKPEENTVAFITRGNSYLIEEIARCTEENKPYSLTRKASEIFKLPLILATLKPGKKITDPQYKFLQESIDYHYNVVKPRDKHTSLFSTLSSIYNQDPDIKTAINIVMKYGTSYIFELYEQAKLHEYLKHSYTITTAHSSKGLEFDKVIIGDDLNIVTRRVIANINGKSYQELSSAEQEIINLYYVACTRAKHTLVNAKLLD